MPIDVYPCTVDEENWSFEDSIENLFGHLCSGTVFMHDEEMKMKKLSRKANFKRRRDDGDSQFMTSSMQGSVEFELAQSQDTSNLPRSSSDVEHHADDDSYHGSKRLRTSQACARTNQGDHGSRTESLPADARSPRRKLRNVKQSFEGVRRHPKAEAALDTRNASSPTLNDTGDPLSLADGPISHHPNPRPTTHPDGDPKVNMRQRSRPEDDPVQIPRGTQAEPIELSDDERLSSDNEAGNFLFERLAEPEHLQKTSDGSQSGDPDTQLSLSDAAFESQLSHITNPDAKAVRMQHRKEAYKAARGLGGRWELDHGLVSSGHLGEEEPEL